MISSIKSYSKHLNFDAEILQPNSDNMFIKSQFSSRPTFSRENYVNK